MLARVAGIASLAGVLYGYDLGVIASALVYLRASFHLGPSMEEWVTSIVLPGVMVGVLCGGTLADRYGRKPTMLWAGMLFTLGSLGLVFAPTVAAVMVGRGVLGFAIGLSSVTAPVYVSELAPPTLRGRLIGLYQLALTGGIALADAVGYGAAGRGGWRLLFGLGALPAAVFTLLVLPVPESPRWLLLEGKEEQAGEVVARLSGSGAAAAEVLQDMRAGLRVEIDRRWSSLLAPAVRRQLFIAVGFLILQQISGINTVLYYGPHIFAAAGLPSDQATIAATLVLAVMNVFATAVALVVVDRVGRKPLLYAGLAGMAGALFALAASFHMLGSGHSMGAAALACLLVYIFCFGASLGPVGWILVSELFPLRVRGRGVAAASLSSGVANFAMSMSFLSLLGTLGSAPTFAFYGAACVLALVFVRVFVPETAGAALERISAPAGAEQP